VVIEAQDGKKKIREGPKKRRGGSPGPETIGRIEWIGGGVKIEKYGLPAPGREEKRDKWMGIGLIEMGQKAQPRREAQGLAPARGVF